MSCSEERLAAFLAGELSDGERAAMDEHLLACALCWRAVQEDRAARLALEQLRRPAPAGLADRVRMAVELASRGTSPQQDDAPNGPRRLAGRRHLFLVPDHGVPRAHRRASRSRRAVSLVAAACLIVTALTGGLVAALGTSSTPSDPQVVSAVVAMAGARSGPPVRLAAEHGSEHMVIAGQSLDLRALRVEGILTVIAVSPQPFAMPSASRVVSGSSSRAWMATRGSVGVYCVNAAPGHHSMLLAAAMPVVQLSALAARMHLVT